jgi:fumarate reductase subunit D
MQIALVWHDYRAPRNSVRAATRATRWVCAWGLVGVIVILIALVGVHELDHLQGRLDARRCAVCQWNYGVTTSLVTAVVALLTLLTLLGQCLNAEPAPAVAASCRARSSRAPPGLA